MLNIYDTIRAGMHFNKFEVGDLLFVEYTCPIEEEFLGVWTQSDYLVYVLSGKKGWRTLNYSWTAESGQAFYIKKGAYIIEQFFDEDFCMLLFFISNDFISDSVKQCQTAVSLKSGFKKSDSPVVEVKNDITLNAYFQSMLTYFTKNEKPSDKLLMLKLRELMFNVLQGESNPMLSSYFMSLQRETKPPLFEIMHKNFCYNLSLQEYAFLCSRSLATFKRDFAKSFNMTPGLWLRKKRIEYATALLGKTNLNISQICLECGFENAAHFSRIFKEELNTTPSMYRKQTQMI